MWRLKVHQEKKSKKIDACPIIGCPIMGNGHPMIGQETLATQPH